MYITYILLHLACLVLSSIILQAPDFFLVAIDFTYIYRNLLFILLCQTSININQGNEYRLHTVVFIV